MQKEVDLGPQAMCGLERVLRYRGNEWFRGVLVCYICIVSLCGNSLAITPFTCLTCQPMTYFMTSLKFNLLNSR